MEQFLKLLSSSLFSITLCGKHQVLKNRLNKIKTATINCNPHLTLFKYQSTFEVSKTQRLCSLIITFQ